MRKLIDRPTKKANLELTARVKKTFESPPDIEELKSIMAYCRANGISKIKTGNIELEITPEREPITESERADIAKALGSDLSDEELLFYSAPQMVPAPRPEDEKE